MSMSLGEQLRAKLAAREWAKDDEAHAQMEHSEPKKFFQVTNNLSRATFDQIQQHPDTRKNVTQALVGKGYKYNSASAIIGHMLRQGVARVDSGGVVRVTVQEYAPLKSAKTLKNMEKKSKRVFVNVRERTTRMEEREEKRPVSSSMGIAALSPAPAKPWSVYGLLETLSILQARDLYDELKKIFEVNK